MIKNLSFGKIGLSLLLLLSVVGIKAQIRTYESVPNDPMKTRIYTLNNGLKIYISVNNENHVFKLTLLCALVVATILLKQQV